MTYRLYGRPHSGSLGVEWLLEELGIAYERVLVTGYRDKIEPAWFTDINPIGQVPVLQLPDGTRMTESGAMMLFLADISPQAGLAPDIDDAARPDYLRWMTFFAATTYPTMMRFFHPDNYVEDERQFEAVKAFGARDAAKQWAMVETALAETGYLAGGRLSAADIYLVMFAVWAEGSFSPWLERFPHTKRLHDDLIARPAIAGILERHVSGAWSD